jgi:hypothetical protein
MNERQFSSLYSGFWLASLPNLEAITRALNYGYTRFQRPLRSRIDPQRRDLVSETAFRLAGLRLSDPDAKISGQMMDDAEEQARTYLRDAPTVPVEAIPRLNFSERSEVRTLAHRTLLFSLLRRTDEPRAVTFMPPFSGHGALEPCSGDLVLDGKEIVEIKCVDRTFRSSDLRQVLTYSALQYFSEGSTFDLATVFNPLKGTYITASLDELIFGAGGKTKEEFFHEFSFELASGELSR